LGQFGAPGLVQNSQGQFSLGLNKLGIGAIPGHKCLGLDWTEPERTRSGLHTWRTGGINCHDSTNPDGPGGVNGSFQSCPIGRSDWAGPQTSCLELDRLRLDQCKQGNPTKTSEVKVRDHMEETIHINDAQPKHFISYIPTQLLLVQLHPIIKLEIIVEEGSPRVIIVEWYLFIMAGRHQCTCTQILCRTWS
jgi:hypothetical protein